MAGSRKGCPNKRTKAYRTMIVRYAKSKDYDPIKAMIDMAVDSDPLITPDLKLRCHQEVACYFAAKLKAVDPNTDLAEDTVIIKVQLHGPAND